MHFVIASKVVCSFALISLMATALAAQRTWVVPVDFPDIQSAVNAASAGDAIFVQTGFYNGATISKGIALLSRATTLRSDLTIVNVPVGQRVTIEGFMLDVHLIGVTPSQRVICRDCVGTVHLEQVSSWGSATGPGLEILNCTQVTTERCTFRAFRSRTLAPEFPYGGGSVGISCTRSSLLLLNTTVQGFNHVSLPQPFGAIAGSTFDQSSLVVVNSLLSGANAPCPAGCLSSLPPAIIATATTIAITGDRTILQGGRYQNTCNCPPPPAIEAGTGTMVHLDPVSSVGPIAGGQVVQQHIPYMGSTAGAPGGQLVLNLTTNPGPAVYAMGCGLPGGPVNAPPVGIWLDLNQNFILAAGSIHGQVNLNITIPSTLPLGVPLTFQSLLLSSGATVLSTPTTAVLF